MLSLLLLQVTGEKKSFPVDISKKKFMEEFQGVYDCAVLRILNLGGRNNATVMDDIEAGNNRVGF